MINYFNFKQFDDEFLVTNDLGKYAFLNKKDFIDLVKDRVDSDSETGQILAERGFIHNGSQQGFIDDTIHLMRDSKNYVFLPTSLHIFVVTNACNMNCIYCQANNGTVKPHDMMFAETAEKAVDIALSAPSNSLTFEFQGGEPLLNFPVIKHIVEYTEAHKGCKDIEYTIVTNLTLIQDDMIDFFEKYSISVSTSLDGFRELHNRNRPNISGEGTFDDVLRGIEKIRSRGIRLGAIETTTRYSLSEPEKLVDTYYDLGFRDIFIRPLTPLGCANKSWEQIGYTPEEFLDFYKRALLRIISKNAGDGHMREGHASLFLAKILHGRPVNYMELRSPCGASVGEMAYYPSGDIFTCDEGRMLFEMGNDSFRLGNVRTSTYDDITHSPTCCTVCRASITESLPTCCDCVYQPYCGVCPVINLALEKDIIPKYPHNYRCRLYGGMLDLLFYLIKNEKYTSIMKSWN